MTKSKWKISSDLAQLRTEFVRYIYRSNPAAANLIPPAKLFGLRNSKTPLYVLKSKQMTSTKLHQKSVSKSGLRPPCFNRRTGGSGHAQCSIEETVSAPPRYDAKPARFALNQGSRKLCSGGVTCPGLIRWAGLEHQ